MKFKVKQYSNNILIDTSIIEPTINFGDQLFNKINRKIFVYINGDDYSRLPKEIVNNISDSTLNNIPVKDYGDKLKKILAKDVVFVKTTESKDINTINNMRYIVSHEINYIILETHIN